MSINHYGHLKTKKMQKGGQNKICFLIESKEKLGNNILVAILILKDNK